MDLIIAHSRYQRRKLTESMKLCDELLSKNPRDQAAWLIKCSCLVRENEIDELEVEEETMVDVLMGDKKENSFARVGTSFNATSSANPIARPMSKTGRLATGFVRPGTSKQISSKSGASNESYRTQTRSGMPMTSSGRALRLSTASLAQAGDTFFESNKANFRAIAKKKTLSRLIFKYLFYVEHNLKKALELAAEATNANDMKDPWWKLALGKCYYHLGMPKDAQKQLLSSKKHNNNVESYIYLARIYQKEDQVQKAISILEEGLKSNPHEVVLHTSIGRIYDELGYMVQSLEQYRNVLALENCNIEAAANFAAHYFYMDQPEVAAKLYQRLVQLGMNSPEVWNNLALCCFYSSKYDLFYTCFDRAIAAAMGQPTMLCDIWYNIGLVYISLSQPDQAIRCFKISIEYDPDHMESLNNLAVLEAHKNNLGVAITFGERSFKAGINFESAYNLSVWYFRQNNFKQAVHFNDEALKIYGQHIESLQLRRRLSQILNI